MKQILLFLATFFTLHLFGQPMIFLHGSVGDPDWEILKIDFESREFYYDYAGHKGGAIKLNFIEMKEKASGYKSYTVKIPNFSKTYVITGRVSDNLEELLILTMKSTDGTYEKDFRFVGEKAELNGKNIIRNDLKIFSVFNKWLDMNPNYCKEEDCSPEKVMNGSSCEIGVDRKTVSYEYGDINGDAVLDAIVSFDIIQCDGGNAIMCNPVSQAILLSDGLDYKVIDEEHFFTEQNDCISSLTKINADGSISGLDFCWTAEDGRCPSLERKRLYRLNGMVLVQIKK